MVRAWTLQYRSGDVQAGGFGQLRLALVEGPEGLRAELEGRGYVKRVKGANADGWDIASREVNRCSEDAGWEVREQP